MTVGYHAPPRRAKTGVADYAAALLGALKNRGSVEPNAVSADVHLYHLGNNQLHRSIYEMAIEQPGVVILHDAVLHHFYLGAFEQDRYVEEYIYNYGIWEADLARQLWCERAASGIDIRYFRRPMLKRVGERSQTVVVHNGAALSAMREHAPGAHIVEIPHLFEAPPANIEDRSRVRARFKLPDEAFVFAVFGYLRESKRILPILQCFERLHREYPRARLLLAGSFASQDLKRAVEAWLPHPGMTRVEHLNDRDLWSVMNAVDCGLNLRDPGVGETSGIGIRLMSLAKPVIFTDGPEIAEIPLNACIRISKGAEEAAQLAAYMKVLITLPEVVREVGERASRHIRYHHSLDRIADRFWEILCAARPPSH